MSIYNFIKNKLYFKQSTCSANQLQDDFLEYPPIPLNCRLPQTSFDIVAIGKLGGAVFPILLLMKVLSNEKSNISFLKSELKEIDVVKKIASDCTDKWATVVKDVRFSYASQRFVTLCSGILLLPIFLLALPFILAKPISILIATTFRAYKSNNKRFGFFISILKDDYEIFVNPRLILKRGLNISSTISHEHIHLLQHINATNYQSASAGKVRIRNPEMLLLSGFCNDSFILYILEKDEMEARLHEFVLSYCREFGRIPLTFDGFISLISGCRELDDNVLGCLKASGSINYSRDKDKSYSIREEIIAEDVYLALLAIKNSDLRYKFITEALATMYGNLIGYYGDLGASYDFLKQIEGPNLYDRLYNITNQ